MKLTYLAVCSSDANPGVLNKINDWIDAAKDLNLDANTIIISPTGGIRPYLKLNLEIIKSKNKLLFIRNPTHLRIFLFFSILIARINKCKVIIDVPTPIYVLIKEILGHKRKKLIKYFTVFELMVYSSLPFLFSNKIIQYANEHWWFKIGCNKRIFLMGNGINLKRINIRNNYPIWPSDRLNLIGVANIATWHGYDRVIHAMAKFNANNNFNFKVHFELIGDGPELINLKNTATNLKLDKFVTFHGLMTNSKFIETIYERAHIAVSSLGLFRIGLETSSVLKSREYVAIGIPFIYAGHDIDFVEECNFRYKVKNSDNIEDLITLFEHFNTSKFPDPINIRNFAEEKLSIVHKLKCILN